MMEIIRQKNKRIAELRAALKTTDYKTLKYFEGELSEEEYKASVAERKAWREEINALQAEVAELNRQFFEARKAQAASSTT